MTVLLNLPSDGRFYCGPAAIAAFTGFHPFKEIQAAINELRGVVTGTVVKGMNTEEVSDVLGMLGVDCGAVCLGKFETLKAFVDRRPDFVGVVNVTGHFVAVDHGLCLDNGSKFAVPVAAFKGNRKAVWNFIEVKLNSDN